jgi:hypothetical protein
MSDLPLFKIEVVNGRTVVLRRVGNTNKYRRGNNKNCSVCANGWRGNPHTTRLCDYCRRDKENDEWRSTHTDEQGVDDVAEYPAGQSPKPDGGPSSFESDSAIAVMKLYCTAEGTVAEIAEAVGVSATWAYAVIAYWREMYPFTVSELRRAHVARNKIAG